MLIWTSVKMSLTPLAYIMNCIKTKPEFALLRNTFVRKFSIGGLDILKIDKNFTDLCFSWGDLELCLGGLSPPVATGLTRLFGLAVSVTGHFST